MEDIFKALSARKFNLLESVLISSEPRSGSTWLMEMIYNVTDTVINWEPLHHKFGIVPIHFKWGDRPLIPEDDTNMEYLTFMKELLRLERYSDWTLKYCSLDDALYSEKVLTKCVRANLLLPWLTKNINFNHRPIYLLRHPVAVALSQIKTFSKSSSMMEEFIIPDWLNNERFEVHFDYISRLTTLIERKVALWCINNLSLLTSTENNRYWQTVYYEHLVLNPKIELINLLKNIHLNYDEKYLDRVDYLKPSLTDFKKDFNTIPIKQLEKWTLNLNKSQVHNLQRIFDYFNINIYSASEILPTLTP